jgi:hypothetical protein
MNEPQIIEIDPEQAPRTSAIILVLCGFLGVAFFVINVAFTGEDPYQSYTRPIDGDETHVWQGEDKYPMQEGYHILPNVWRGAQQAAEDSSEDELEDGVMTRMAVAANKEGAKKATTKPATPGTVTPNTPAPATPTPTTPAAPNPFTLDRSRQPPQQK